jgi:hypoxanthine phosphoribosyltransferase
MPSELNSRAVAPEPAPKVYVTWATAELAVNYLHRVMLEHKYKPDRLLAIGRGGWFAGLLLSHRFNVTNLESVRVMGYKDGRRLGELLPRPQMTLPEYRAKYNNPDSLIVDDLWDTGRTMTWARWLLPEATTAVMFYKGHRPPISFPGTEIPNNWVVFPWEFG